MSSMIIPTFRYENAPAMIDWLCGTFGFSRKAVFPDEDGGIAHAELVLGNAMIMLGSTREDAFGRIQTTPKRAGGVTQSAYIVVKDVDALFARVTSAEAEIVMGLKDQPYGSREFSCRDPEGHVWNFGTYDPWAN